MVEKNGSLVVKCMGQVTKSHLYHLLGVSDYYVKYTPFSLEWRPLPSAKGVTVRGENPAAHH